MKNHKKILIVVLFSLLAYGIPSISQAAFDITAWPYYRQVNIETLNNTSGLLKFQLPKDFLFTKPDFSDLRIIDGQGIETPFLLTRNINTQSPSISAKLINTSIQNNGSTVFIADTGQNGIVRTNISIQTSSLNFRRQVSIYASDSLLGLNDTRWDLVTNSGYIFKFTDPNTGYSSGKDSIEFSANTSRYFKIVISSGPEGNVEVTGASVQGSIKILSTINTIELPVSITNNAQKKATEITVDLGDIGHLTNAITLYPTDPNYSRRVIVEAINELSTDNSWTYVGQGSISNISTSVFQGSSNKIVYPEQLYRYIRISIINDDNPPLSVSQKAVIDMPQISGIFEAKSNKTYSLYYGNRNAFKSQYDINQLSSYIDEPGLPVVIPGNQITNSSYTPPKGPIVPYSESHKGLLNGLLVFVVLIVGGGILFYIHTYIKKAKLPNDQDSNGQDTFKK